MLVFKGNRLDLSLVLGGRGSSVVIIVCRIGISLCDRESGRGGGKV